MRDLFNITAGSRDCTLLFGRGAWWVRAGLPMALLLGWLAVHDDACAYELGRAPVTVTETTRDICVTSTRSMVYNFGAAIVGVPAQISQPYTVTCRSSNNVRAQVIWGGVAMDTGTYTFSDDKSTVRMELSESGSGQWWDAPTYFRTLGPTTVELRLTYTPGGPGAFRRSGVLKLTIL